jgi:predicted transcriptional regulator
MIPSGKELRTLRETLGLTQKELARRIGVSQSFIAKIENEKIDPRLSIVKRIMDELLSMMNTEETVDKIMNSPVITVGKEDLLNEIFDKMQKHGISQVPVVDNEGRVIGMIYDYVILRKVMGKRAQILTAENLMVEPPPLIKPTSPADVAMKLLLKYQAVLVIDDKLRPIGIVTRSDIIRYKLSTSNSYTRWAPAAADGLRKPEETPASYLRGGSS